MQGTMPGTWRRGRPRTAWMDNIKTWTGLTVEESIRMTENRDKWRKYVHGVAKPRIEDGWRKNKKEHWVTYLSEAVFSLVLACSCGCNSTWLWVNAKVCITDAGWRNCSSVLRNMSTCDDVASSSNAIFISCQRHTPTSQSQPVASQVSTLWPRGPIYKTFYDLS